MYSRALTATLVVALLAGSAAPVSAQTELRPYVLGGWSIGPRDTDSVNPVPDDPSGVVQGLSLGAGLKFSSNLSAEASFGWHTADVTAWNLFVSGSGSGQRLTTDRDVHVVGLIRWSYECSARLCADVVAGGGINSHKVTSIQQTACAVTCVPVNEPDETSNHSEYVLTGGVDFRVKLGGGFDLLPGFRIRHIFRRGYLTEWGGHGPFETDTSFFAVSVSAMYRFGNK